MKTVYKYKLEKISNIQEIQLPVGCNIIKVGMIANDYCIWAEVDSEETELSTEKFVILGTGHEMFYTNYYEYNHVDSFVNHPYIWHVYHLAPKR